MGLLELCLLTMLSPQDPVPGAAPTMPPAPAAAPQDPDTGDRAQLAAAERAGAKADAATLARLAASPDGAVAARAAWLLGQSKDQKALALSGAVATGSPHADARLQAMSTLLRCGDKAAVTAATRCLEDADRRVRTLAAQLLGKLKRPTSVAPLVAMIERRGGQPAEKGPATDVQAALVALHDLGASDQLLRVATSLHDVPAPGAGESLTYCFQALSPKLERQQEITLLLGVLDHREPLLRRYAIGRLAEHGDPNTASALEGRLAKESAELRPLVEVALGRARGPATPPATEGLEQVLGEVKAQLKEAATAAGARWNQLSERDRWIAGTVPVALLLALVLAGRLRRRHRTSDSAAAAVAMVAPSQEHLDEMAAEAEALAAAAEAEAMTRQEEDEPAGADAWQEADAEMEQAVGSDYGSGTHGPGRA